MPKDPFGLGDVAAAGGVSKHFVRELAAELEVGEDVGGRLIFTGPEMELILDAIEDEVAMEDE